MIAQDKIHSLYDLDVIDRDGDRIGSVGAVWNDAAGQPAWASVRTGLFGLNESLFPLQHADLRGGRLVVPFDKATVKDAPNVDADHDEPLSRDEVDRLYEHYGLNWEETYRAYQAGGGVTNRSHQGARDYEGGREDDGARDYDGARDSTHDYDGDRESDAMTRSEERLTVGTENERAGRARLRKYVVTDQERVSVPVSREEVRLEREPVTEANRGDAYAGPDITESEHEVTLHAERPVVDTEAVPVERVRLGKETVTEEREVAGEVRKERIEADLPDQRGRHTLD
ncbi:photosystem reaction center subunit H [Actinoplanes sp. OR16]|uniref:PRC and DUF2382 domain-containing protein n=1 Tax=Actinoplanes sp. OR16 TaxID=946334 RepID=UPI000F6D4235|nr:PRC and DUF2382 domain-containing protein [Actinoplanes sp. OR16]BBH68527.1 photosystem reaction center subunit H [Actinoplanes sp. OR16]